MKKLFFILLLIPFLAQGQNIYFLASYANGFRIGNAVFPLNSVSLVISRDTNAVGFNYVLIPPSTFQFEHTIISPTNFSNYYTISGSDTVSFTNADSIRRWFLSNAISATGNLDMEIGEQVIGATNNLPLYVDGSGNLAQYLTKPLLAGDTTSGVIPTNSKMVGYTKYTGGKWSPDTGANKLATKTDLRAKIAYSDTTATIVTQTYLTSLGFTAIAFVDYSTTGIALQTNYVIPHGLAYTPTDVIPTPMSLGASGISYLTWDDTNITVHFAAAPGVVSIVYKFLCIK